MNGYVSRRLNLFQYCFSDNLQPNGSLEGFSVVSSENASLLGAPLSAGDALDNALEVKFSELRNAISPRHTYFTSIFS